MGEFVNIYAGALVARSSLRNQAGLSGQLPPQTNVSPGPGAASVVAADSSGSGQPADPVDPQN